MKESDQLRQEKAKAWERLSALRDRARDEGRDLLASEQRSWDLDEARIEDLNTQISRAVEHEDFLRSGPLTPIGPGSAWGGPESFRGSGALRSEPEILGPGESVRYWAERHGMVASGEPRFGRWLQALVRGEPMAALGESIGSQGGYLTPFGVSAEIIDLARAQTVMTQAGALMRPIETTEQSYPRLSQDPTFSWVPENTTIPEGSMAFQAVTHNPHKLATIIRLSVELLEDADGLETFVRSALAQASAVVIDAAGLRGDGVDKPAGIRTWSGVTLISLGTNGATPTGYGQLMDAITAVRAANFEPSAMIAAPRTYGTYGKLTEATTGQPLRAPTDVEGLQKFSTTSVPIDLTQGSSTDTSEVYIGDFSNYVFSVRVGFELQVLRERYADAGQVGLLARLRVDGSPLRDAAWAVVTGLRP